MTAACATGPGRGRERHGHAELAEHAVAFARARVEPVPLADALSASALAHTMSGNPAAALPDAEEIGALIHRLPNPHIYLPALVMAAFALGDSKPDRAFALAREVVALTAAGERNIAWALAGDLEPIWDSYDNVSLAAIRDTPDSAPGSTVRLGCAAYGRGMQAGVARR